MRDRAPAAKAPYTQAVRAFRWDAARRALGWDAPSVALGATIVDRHASVGRPALRAFDLSDQERALTFAELASLSDRVAQLLVALGVGPGDRVAGFLPRVPETIATMIGTWKAGAIYVPIFTGFGADAIAYRARHSEAAVLVTHARYRGQVPETGARVVTVGGARGGGVAGGPDVEFDDAIARAHAPFDALPRRRDEPAVLLYTSGSTGPPKGVEIATNFLLAVQPYLTYGLDLRDDDVFWPTGDPAWGYGLVCYMAALARGVGVVMHEAPPTPDYVLARLTALGVTNLATTPTLLRGIMALGATVVRRRAVALRAISSCGEPLNAEVVEFFRRVWNVTVMDHYGASEFGLPIGNFNTPAVPVKPGSMGLPMPGCTMAVVDEAGQELGPDQLGHVAMRPDPDGYYALGYWRDAARTRDMSREGWITIGDLARRDADGYFWFEGRADDVIKTSGYRVGPFEVESAILEHPAVAEVAIVGKADAVRGHIVKAFVVLKPDVPPATEVVDEITELVRSRVGKPQAPREVQFVQSLPKTESGKIQRFRLRAAEQNR